MAGTNYHNEALRKTRMIERKSEAMTKLQEELGQHTGGVGIVDTSRPSNLKYSEAGHFAQNRFDNVDSHRQKNEVVFEEVVHDPNFKYRIAKESRSPPVHVDPIYQILYPSGVATNNNDKDRIRHRRCRAQNEGDDHVMPLMNPPEYNFIVPVHELPPRKPHFKV